MNVTGLASAPLVIATDPVGVYLLDLLAEGGGGGADGGGGSGGGGAVSREALVAGALDRLDTTEEAVTARLASMVDAGFAMRVEQGGAEPAWRGCTPDELAAAFDSVVEVLRSLDEAGDSEQATDAVAAIDAAWATRSTAEARRAVAEAFRLSPAGQRHARRVAEGTLGLPFGRPRPEEA
jgi:hypothetical protein